MMQGVGLLPVQVIILTVVDFYIPAIQTLQWETYAKHNNSLEYILMYLNSIVLIILHNYNALYKYCIVVLTIFHNYNYFIIKELYHSGRRRSRLHKLLLFIFRVIYQSIIHHKHSIHDNSTLPSTLPFTQPSTPKFPHP